ncbi:MAG: hypothetical protein KGK12_07935, partial [Armatimonadetes bacterium]|nr:hypothetical protein [Armatimonadota bacterium]
MNLNTAADLPDEIVVDALDDKVVDGIPAGPVQNVNAADDQLWPGAGDDGSAERRSVSGLKVTDQQGRRRRRCSVMERRLKRGNSLGKGPP